ncbi:hypothetical protein ACFYV5_08425 [Streptomyces sp. NPDC003035]|uniref:hypothetical protein n=1 Tax=Streptomyces sp. NPDC003035 TaxID=3364676 RepID=UPI00368BF66C
MCGVLRGRRNASVVAARFVGAGWSSRSSSWDGYEPQTSWCQVEIDPLNRVVGSPRLDELGGLLGFPYELELSDESERMTYDLPGG